MKGLILKDIINLRKNFKIFGLLSVLYIILAVTSKDTGFFSSVITMLFAILTLSLFSYDDLAKWDIYALTMPVTKEDMVSSKYIMLILLTLFGTVFSGIITIGINIVLHSESLFTSVSNSFSGAIIVIVLYSIVFPFIIKLGVDKSRIIFFIAIIVPYVVASTVNAIMKEGTSEIPEGLIAALDFFSRYSYLVLPVIALVVLYLSYCISVGIYRRKDF